MKTTEIDGNVERHVSTVEKQSNRPLNPEAKGTVDIVGDFVLIGSGVFGPSIVGFITNPNVQILVKTTDNGYKASFEMSNNGVTSATNLKLVIKTPMGISSYDKFSTENISLSMVNDRLLEGYLERFVQGDGSKVVIDLTLTPDPKVSNIISSAYQAYATYDQGSSKGVLSLSSFSFWFPMLIILYAAGYGVALYLVMRKRKQRKLKKMRNLEVNLEKQIFSASSDSTAYVGLSNLRERVLDEYANMNIDEKTKKNLMASINHQLEKI